MAEEEEASTRTCSFSRILNLFDILGRIQWLNDILVLDVVKDSDFPECFRSILSYDDSSIQVERVIFNYLALRFIVGTSKTLGGVRKDSIVIKLIEILDLLVNHAEYVFIVEVKTLRENACWGPS